MDKEHIQTVKTTETTFEIIQSLKDKSGATLSTIARELDMSKSTVRKHLQTLYKHEFVVHNDDGIFRLSLEFFDIGERALKTISIYEPAIPVVDEIAKETNEKAQLMVEENGMGYYIHRTKGHQGISTRDGRRVELHCTSAGKAALAFMDRDYVREIVDHHGLPQRTERTITDRSKFFDELDNIQEQGFATNDEERLKGLRAVGAPILDENEEVLGAISLSGPTIHLRGDRFREELPELVIQSADVIRIRSQYS